MKEIGSTVLARVAAAPFVNAICISTEGRSIGLDPGDFALVTGPTGAEGSAGASALRLLLPSRPDLVEWLQMCFQLGKESFDDGSRLVYLNELSMEAALDLLHAKYRVVGHRLDETSPWVVVRKQLEQAVLDPQDADLLRGDAPPMLTHETLLELLTLCLDPGEDAADLVVEVFGDTLFRGGFFPLQRYANPILVWGSGGILIRCRVKDGDWACARLYSATAKEFEELIGSGLPAVLQEGRRDTPAQHYSLLPIERARVGDEVEQQSNYFLALPELRLSNQLARR